MSFYKNIGAFKVWKQGLPVDAGLIYKKRSSNTLYEIVDVTDRGVIAHGRCGACCFNRACGTPARIHVPPCDSIRLNGRVVYFKKISV